MTHGVTGGGMADVAETVVHTCVCVCVCACVTTGGAVGRPAEVTVPSLRGPAGVSRQDGVCVRCV